MSNLVNLARTNIGGLTESELMDLLKIVLDAAPDFPTADIIRDWNTGKYLNLDGHDEGDDE